MHLKKKDQQRASSILTKRYYEVAFLLAKEDESLTIIEEEGTI
jgi:hypothetical protein